MSPSLVYPFMVKPCVSSYNLGRVQVIVNGLLRRLQQLTLCLLLARYVRTRLELLTVDEKRGPSRRRRALGPQCE